MSATDRRASLATAVRVAAGLTLSAAIVLSPFRARFYIEERRIAPIFSDYTDLILFWSGIVVIAVLALWLISLLLLPRRIDFGPLLIRVPVVMIVLTAFLAAPFSDEPALAAYNAVAILGFVLLGLYVLNEVKGVSQVLPALGLMIVIQAVVAITQVLGQREFGLTMIGEFNLDPALSGMSILWTDDAPRLLRGYGLSDHPNILGGVLAAALLVLLAGIGRYRDAWLAVACGVFAVGVAAVFVTFSRSAAVGLAAGLGFAFLLLALRRDWAALAPWAAACVVAVLVTAPLIRPYTDYLIARVNPTAEAAGSTEERSLNERDALARNTNEIFVENPLIGVGAGVLPEAMKDAFPDFGYHYSPAHVVILVVAAETGIVGAFAYGLLMLAPFVLLWVRRQHLTPELIGVSGALVALTVIGLLDYYTWSLNAGRLWFWLVLGLWVVAYRGTESRAADA
jgi:O-antigen ligase